MDTDDNDVIVGDDVKLHQLTYPSYINIINLQNKENICRESSFFVYTQMGIMGINGRPCCLTTEKTPLDLYSPC